MEENILTHIFLNLYYSSNNNKKDLVKYKSNLEKILENYLISVLGDEIKNNYQNNLMVVKIYLENLVNNINHNLDFEEGVIEYSNRFNDIKESHPYLKLFMDSMKKIYDKAYDGKILSGSNKKKLIYDNIIAINHKNDGLTLGRINKKYDLDLPAIHIYNIDNFDRILKEYVEAVEQSDCYYNLFSNENFKDVSYGDKIKILFECTMFNCMPMEASYIEKYFKMYTDFINDDTFSKIKHPVLIGNLFDDELYVMNKRSELEYETPYYLAFMLRNKVVELPNIRLGIQNRDVEKSAHIIASQSSQIIQNNENLAEIQNIIKRNLPTNSNFRQYNPTHLVSILLTFGLLNGMGINKIYVNDYMPFRFNKTVLDRQLNDFESDNYQSRLTNKNLNTYMRLIELADGAEIINYPDFGEGLVIKLDDEIQFKNQFLQEIYDMAYKAGGEYSIRNNENNKRF